MRIKTPASSFLMLLLTWLTATASFAADPATINFRIRDSATGRAVAASVVDRDAAAVMSERPAAAEHTVTLTENEHRFAFRAAGHQPLESRFSGTPGERLPVTVLLDPVELPQELRPEVVASKLREGYSLLHGHVVNAATGEPMRGASVRVNSAQLTTKTNARGYFAIQVPVFSRLFDEGDYPDMDDVFIEAPEYKTHAIRNTFLLDRRDTHFIVEMESGNGRVERDDAHKMWLHRPDGPHPGDEERIQELSDDHGTDHAHRAGHAHGADHVHGAVDVKADGAERLSTATEREIVATGFGVPGSIRVGTSCSCNSCSGVITMSMQTYVKRGLNDEWIASWHGESLRAGAVAYRSYGAWHVLNPKTSSYDICSSTCCQVNDSDTAYATDLAADATNNIVLQRGGAIFRSEYSSENNAWNDPNDGLRCVNNDQSCGDGNAGSPATGWPCLSDGLCRGRGCYGHGRGMCQWGTQRWANNGQSWRWIVSHYYNANGRPGGNRSAYASGGCVVGGDILAKYNQLGAEGGLGMCTTDELTTPDGVGRFNHFEFRASIYWTPDTGAHSVVGAIRQKWADLGWETSLLRYPTTDELGTPDGVGRFNHFQRGSIYWTPDTGAHYVFGAIQKKWADLGWERSFLRYPTTDETGTPDGVGRFNHFQGGSIYWTSGTGAWSVQGAIRNKWASMGWERSCLGYPISDEFSWNGGRRSNFQRGHIFWTSAAGATASCQ